MNGQNTCHGFSWGCEWRQRRTAGFHQWRWCWGRLWFCPASRRSRVNRRRRRQGCPTGKCCMRIMCIIMTAEIWESYGGKNPPKLCVRKILHLNSSQSSSESPAIKILLSTTGLIRGFFSVLFSTPQIQLCFDPSQPIFYRKRTMSQRKRDNAGNPRNRTCCRLALPPFPRQV